MKHFANSNLHDFFLVEKSKSFEFGNIICWISGVYNIRPDVQWSWREWRAEVGRLFERPSSYIRECNNIQSLYTFIQHQYESLVRWIYIQTTQISWLEDNESGDDVAISRCLARLSFRLLSLLLHGVHHHVLRKRRKYAEHIQNIPYIFIQKFVRDFKGTKKFLEF